MVLVLEYLDFGIRSLTSMNVIFKQNLPTPYENAARDYAIENELDFFDIADKEGF